MSPIIKFGLFNNNDNCIAIVTGYTKSHAEREFVALGYDLSQYIIKEV